MLLDAGTTPRQLDGADARWAVLPIGAVEQHGAHLPLGTDWIIAEHLGRRVAELLGRERDVFLAPSLPYSLSQCHGPAPGTAWLLPRTLGDVFADIVASLVAWGMRCIAIVNAHGGNFCLRDEIAELDARYPDTVIVDAGACPRHGPRETGRLTGGDIHAGAGETSMVLAIAPSLVGPYEKDAVPSVGREFLDYAYLTAIVPSGVWGRPSAASPEAGSIALEALARSMAGWVEETVALAPQTPGRSA